MTATWFATAPSWEFIQSGGYLDKARTEAGWEWRAVSRNSNGRVWVPDGPAGLHRYRLRTSSSRPSTCPELAGPRPMPMRPPPTAPGAAPVTASPVDCPTAEHNASARRLVADTDPLTTRTAPPRRELGWNSQLAHGRLGWRMPADRRPFGIHDVFGNVWQASTIFNPLPGARVHPYYDDFSTPVTTASSMILGGSWISCGDEASGRAGQLPLPPASSTSTPASGSSRRPTTAAW